MPLLTALAISIGVLALIATWVFLGPLAAFGVQIWQAFVAWGCFYHCGGKAEGLQKTVICMCFGALIGALSVLAAGYLGMLGEFAAPVAVGVGVFILVIAANLSLLSTIPAAVYGFASVAGLILLKSIAPINALAPTIGSIVIGALLGWVSEFVAGKIAKPAAATAAA